MGIAQIPKTKEQLAEEKEPIQVVLREKVAQPIKVAGTEFWRKEPKAFLEFCLMWFGVTVAVISELITDMPWGWYLVLAVLLLRSFDFKFKKIKRKK